jgi:hypothetical protein
VTTETTPKAARTAPGVKAAARRWGGDLRPALTPSLSRFWQDWPIQFFKKNMDVFHAKNNSKNIMAGPEVSPYKQ